MGKYSTKNKLLWTVFCGLLTGFFLSGCATVYTVEPGAKKYNNGYIVKRNSVIIPEFTVDTQGKAPSDLALAKERFKRRKSKILFFYKKMGYFGSTVMEDAQMFPTSLLAPFRAPIDGLKYHKYETDPAYRAKVDAQDEKEEKFEQEKILAIQKQMQQYIEDDVAAEVKDKATSP
jgi:hypothetical protein